MAVFWLNLGFITEVGFWETAHDLSSLIKNQFLAEERRFYK